MVDHKLIKRIFKESEKGRMDTLKRVRTVNPEFHWCNLLYGSEGETILHVAARKGYLDLIEYLLSFNPAAVDFTNISDKTPLHDAAQFGQLQAARLLLDEGAEINAMKRGDWTPLMLSCTKIQPHSKYLVKYLLDNGALINCKNKDGWTAIHIVSREGDVDILEMLRMHGANVRLKTKNDRTALHISSLHGQAEIVKKLLVWRLEVNAQDKCGNSPLHEAVLGNRIDICKLLVDRGARVSCRTNTGFSLLHLAASHSSLEVVQYILDELYFDINDKTTVTGVTALHCAARKNRKEIYNYLLKCGIDPTIKDIDGRTAVSFLS